MLSAGPCHLCKFANLKINATIVPAISGPLNTKTSLGKPNNKFLSPLRNASMRIIKEIKPCTAN